MEQISIKTVSSREYSKRAKRFGIRIKKRTAAGWIKQNVFYILVAALFFLIIATACSAMMSIKSLWYDTLIKPPIIPRPRIFLIGNWVMFAILGCVFYFALVSKNRGRITGMIINGVFYIIVAYTFYVLKSPLGCFIVISVLVAQTATVMAETWRAKRAVALLLVPVILWQCYILFVDYLVLMLN